MCSFQPEPSGDDPNWLIFFKGVVEKPPTSFSTWILQGYVYFCLPCHLHWCFFSLLVPQGRFIQLNRPGREQCVGFTLRSPLHFARGSFTTIHTHCKHNIDYIYLLYYICHVYLSPVKPNASPSKTLDDFSRHVWAVARWRAAELSTYVSTVVIGRNGDAKWAPTVPNINVWL